MIYAPSEAAPEGEGAPTFRNLTPQELATAQQNGRVEIPGTASVSTSAPSANMGGGRVDAERPLTSRTSGDAELPLSSRVPVRGSGMTIATPSTSVALPDSPSASPSQVQTSVVMRDFYKANGLPPKPVGRYGDMTNAELELQNEIRRANELEKIRDVYRARDDERTRAMNQERDKAKYDSAMAVLQTRIAADYAKLKDTQEWKENFDANKEINRRAQIYMTKGATEQDARLQAAGDLADEVALKKQAKELGIKNTESLIKTREEATRRAWAALEIRVKEKEMAAAKIPRGEIGIVRAEANKANTLRKEVAQYQGQVDSLTDAVKESEAAMDGLSGFALQQQQQILQTRKTQLAVAQNKMKASQEALTASETRLKPYEQFIEKSESGYYGVNPNTATPNLSGGGVPSRSGGGSGTQKGNPLGIRGF